MPRGPRLDAPGALHHVLFRGIERRKIFVDDRDRYELLGRLEDACADGAAIVYAWCLMGNHVHLAMRTGTRPLSKTMSSVIGGYAQSFNLRNKRSGHLMQNRYKSTVVEEERYFLGLVRYIHLNPMRARIVGDVGELARYPWSGHAVLMGKSRAAFQDTDEVLSRFGSRTVAARRELVKFMGAAEAKKDVKVFGGAGGGLVRSIGGPTELREHGKGPKWAHDDRVLGSGEFVTRVLERAGDEHVEVIRDDEERRAAYDELAARVGALLGVDVEEMASGSRRREAARARQVVSYIATRKLGVESRTVARRMNVTPPAITAAAKKGKQTLQDLGWETEELLPGSRKERKLIK